MVPFEARAIDRDTMAVCQREIRIVHEEIGDRDDDFNIARRMLHDAERIYFMGFGYGAKNVERLMFEQRASQSLLGTAKDLTPREMSAVSGMLKGSTLHLYQQDCLDFLRNQAALD